MRKCKVCGCTEMEPCQHPDHGPCWWVSDTEDICSHCSIQEIKNDPATMHPKELREMDPVLELLDINYNIMWFNNSPDAGDPQCKCSWCNQVIEKFAVRITNDYNQEARLHQECFNKLINQGLTKTTDHV